MKWGLKSNRRIKKMHMEINKKSIIWKIKKNNWMVDARKEMIAIVSYLDNWIITSIKKQAINR